MENIDTSQLTKALHALKVYYSNKENAENDKNGKDLFNDGSHITLHLTLKKMLGQTDFGVKFVDTILRHGYLDAKTLSICLFVKDLDSKNDYKDHDVDKAARYYKDMLKEEKNVVGLDEIIALSQLKREYKTFESRRKLCTAYDLFLVDDRITKLVSGCIGKQFRASKKMPFSIRISRGNINASIEKCLSTARFSFKNLSSRCAIKFGSIHQPLKHLLENFHSVFESIDKKLPGGFNNVRSMNISLDKTPLLPIYVSLESSNLVKILPTFAQNPKPVVDDLNTIDDEEKKVCVFADGRVKVVDSDNLLLQKGGKRKIARVWKKSQTKKRRFHKKSKSLTSSTTPKNEPPTDVKVEDG
jgi:ribosome biogenesis protein UTP30